MKINRNDFLKILDVAAMAVAGKDQVEQLGHFIFTGENVITFNNRLCIYYPLKTDFECSVRSNLFHKQLEKFETEEIDITLEARKMTLKGHREKAELSVTLERDDEIFNLLEKIREGQEGCEYSKIPDDFTNAVDFCAFSASSDAAQGTLCCLCIHNQQVMSTDNYRATVYEMSESMGDQLLIDAAISKEIKKFDMHEWAREENWVHFRNKDAVVLSARQIFGDYPPMEKAFDFEGERMKLPVELTSAIDFVEVLLAEEHSLDRMADINIKNGLITACVTKANECSEKSVDLPAKYKDLDITFRVNVNFLASILNHTTTMIYNVDEQRAMFKSKNFKHAIRIMQSE